ncbi:hypothetical protein [Kosmotoga sp.]|uniref:hypothetical protein n=1 Tax=Kosmotoga sp. TaxID=1955248 RepID=UPI0024AAA917|nr:hypothetical protein [Kosmotoga sp.]MDI3523684.1 hypothetical protein [Kosmotoga sp.]
MRKVIVLSLLLLTTSLFFAFGPELSFGTVTLGATDSYFVYMFHYPVTDIIPGIDLDFGFDMYQTEIGGQMYFGKPSLDATPSTNVLNGFSIYAVSLRTKLLDLRYGKMGFYSKGIGLLLNSYTKPRAWAFDANIKFFQPGLSLHVPFEIVSLNPFVVDKTSSLWFGGVFFDLPLNLKLDTTFVWESNSAITDSGEIPAYGLTASLDFPIVNWKLIRLIPSAETAILATKDFSHIGFGAGVGARAAILDLLRIRGGLVYYSENFIPGYYNADYEYKKMMELYEGQSWLPRITDAATPALGWFIRGDVGIGDMLILKVNVDSYNTLPNSPVVKGYFRVRIPEVNLGKFGGVPEFFAEAGYYQDNFPVAELFGENWKNALLNENTRLSFGAIYPLAGNMAAHFIVNYNPAAKDFDYLIMFESLSDRMPGAWLDPSED